ncbi:MAG: DUF4242 domain-containing protein [Pirellulales bacterium]|nr:DUF4242 domain-containing protein [Pirellulales bacterium]
MQRFLCLHTLPAGSMTKDQVYQIADAVQHDARVHGYRSFLNLSEGKGCCILEANDRETIASWFQMMGIPYDCIVPVELEGERGVIEDLRESLAPAGVA